MITAKNYEEAAKRIGCEVNVIRAVAGVESGGSGFLKDGRVLILFEPHVFWRQLIAKRINPQVILLRRPELGHVLYERWGTYPYGHISEQWDRVNLATSVNQVAALSSASWGKFQIMGYHFERCGYASIDEMQKAFSVDESNHLKAFVSFIISTGLDRFLSKKDWTNFARNYNGAGYRNSPSTVYDDYDWKLVHLYDKLCLTT
jgi:hypothetical protein